MCLIAFNSFQLCGQESEIDVNPYFLMDQTIGKTNSGLLTGVVYEERHPVKGEKHKFFLSPDFITGKLNYDGQSYYGYEIKYNVFEDELLVRHQGIKGVPTVKLLKNRVVDFEIDGHFFENIESTQDRDLSFSGFLEMLLTGENFTLYKNHKKKILKKTSKEGVDYQFKDRSDLFIRYNDQWHKLKSIKDIYAIDSRYKNELTKLAQKYAQIKKSDFEKFTLSIFTDFKKVEIKTKEDKNEG